MRRIVASVVASLVCMSSTAGAEVDFCRLWRGVSASHRASFIKEQARVLLVRDAPEIWTTLGECIGGDVAQWLAGVNRACSGPDAMDFDGGRMLGAGVAASLLRCQQLAKTDM